MKITITLDLPDVPDFANDMNALHAELRDALDAPLPDVARAGETPLAQVITIIDRAKRLIASDDGNDRRAILIALAQHTARDATRDALDALTAPMFAEAQRRLSALRAQQDALTADTPDMPSRPSADLLRQLGLDAPAAQVAAAVQDAVGKHYAKRRV